MRTFSAWLAIMVCLCSAVRVDAQDVENPHGDFREDCRLCHTSNAWSPMRVDATFDHTRTGFALQGAHADTPCLLCHETLEFKAVQGNQCADCHQDVHLGELGPDCSRCHSARDFIDRSEAVRQHRTSRFPLTGSHLSTDCAACHIPVDGSPMRFVNTPVNCESCHMEAYRATSNPNHVAAGFAMDCAQCHSTLSWGTGDFDHALTAFPLTGAHGVLQCQSCHTDLSFAEKLGTECASCHLENSQLASNPPHVGLSTNCTDCHTTNAWAPAAFDHGLTAFALTGAHVATSCAQCHVNDTWAGIPQDCFSCHVTAYQATTQPQHETAGYSTNCTQCHSTVQWQGANVDHNLTAFPLTGAHVQVSCTQCHVGDIYAGTPQDCFSCHTPEYQATAQPPHAAAGFTTDCSQCHNTSQWPGASWNHNQTAFPLTGSHVQASCTQCHVNDVYTGTAQDCFACHMAEYQATSQPQHTSAGFSTDCSNCHDTTQWLGATFDHDARFPINSGKHREAWNDCSDCHVNPSNFSQFECILCHEHSNQSEMANKHEGRRDYQFLSAACFSCHPDGLK